MQNMSVFTEMELGQMGMEISGSKSWNLLLAQITQSFAAPKTAEKIDFDALRNSKFMDGETRWSQLKDAVMNYPEFQKPEYAGLIPFIEDFIKNPESISIDFSSDNMKNLMTLVLENAAIPTKDGLQLEKRGISFKVNNKAVNL